MQSVLSCCRYMLARHRGLRVLWALTVLGLLLATAPRWEVHQHALIDHHHAHVDVAHDHHHDVIDNTDADDNGAITHFHSTPSFSIALIEACLPSLERVFSKADAFTSPEANPQASCWPPPHRPPIA